MTHGIEQIKRDAIQWAYDATIFTITITLAIAIVFDIVKFILFA